MRAKIGIEIDKQCSSCNYCCVSEDGVDLECFRHKIIIDEEELCDDWNINTESLYENIEFMNPKYIGEIK